MIRLNRKNTSSIEYHFCDAEKIEDFFNKKQFNIVFSSNLLEHISNPKKVLRSIHKILKDDGITIHIMPNPFWKLSRLLLNIPYKFLFILN